MRSRRDDIPLDATLWRAKTLHVCGFGGTLRPPPDDLDNAVARAAEQHDIRLARRIGRFATVADGSFVWTRDDDQLFWLGCIEGSWWYDGDERAAAVDLVHVRPCAWANDPVLASEAPAAVLATFGRGGRNFQRIHDSLVGAQTDVIWHRSHRRRGDQ
ncbi:MAG: hypothetical protein JWQ86_6266 [Mycobacterium sp.]|jgi:hypothetical protein|nr:hypothetical protein [Mycobacterium sp.]MDT5250667.1 hypothetical protein [Mycobacterium sp.]